MNEQVLQWMVREENKSTPMIYEHIPFDFRRYILCICVSTIVSKDLFGLLDVQFH